MLAGIAAYNYHCGHDECNPLSQISLLPRTMVPGNQGVSFALLNEAVDIEHVPTFGTSHGDGPKPTQKRFTPARVLAKLAGESRREPLPFIFVCRKYATNVVLFMQFIR